MSRKSTEVLMVAGGSAHGTTLLENKIMAYGLFKMQSISKKDIKYRSLVCKMWARELMEVMKVNRGSFYADLHDVAQRMRGRMVSIYDPDRKSLCPVVIIDDAEYKDGEFVLVFTKNLEELIGDGRVSFTLEDISTIMSFNSNFSFRLWEVLRSGLCCSETCEQKKSRYTLKYSVSELRVLFCLVNIAPDFLKSMLAGSSVPDYDRVVAESSGGSYEDWHSCKRSVLDVAVREINKRTNIVVDYRLERAGKGGKVCDVTFFVKEKEQEEQEVTQEEKDKCLEYISSIMVGLRYSHYVSIAEAVGYDNNKISAAWESMGGASGLAEKFVTYMCSVLSK